MARASARHPAPGDAAAAPDLTILDLPPP